MMTMIVNIVSLAILIKNKGTVPDVLIEEPSL
jgi:hypothetical protein